MTKKDKKDLEQVFLGLQKEYDYLYEKEEFFQKFHQVVE